MCIISERKPTFVNQNVNNRTYFRMKAYKLIWTIFLAATGSICASAQNINNHNISGTVFDGDMNEPLPIAAVQVLSLPDSSMAKGAVTDNDGKYSISGLKNGNYVIKVSYIGYKDSETKLSLTARSDRNVRVPQIKMVTDSRMLAETTITAEVPKVQAIKDTIVFNSAAYRLSETATIQELIKKLPGVDMDSDGNITVNGKAVTQILINGKEYLGENITTLLENLPANVIDRLKTYEKKSDLARITGIDDGEEQTVFDLHTKEEMKGGLLNTYDLAYGSDYGKHDLYSGQVMVNRFTDHNSFTLWGHANNVIDQGIGNGGRQWGNNRGINTTQEIEASYAYTNDKIDVNANLSMMHRENDFNQKGNSERFYGSSSSFSNNFSKNINNSNSYRANFYVEWRPDSMTNVIIRPYLNKSLSESNSESASATYNSDPYEFMDDPLFDMLDTVSAKTGGYNTLFVNRNTGQSHGDNNNLSGGGSIQANRRIGNKGRNLTLRLSADLNKGTNNNWSYNTTTYYQTGKFDYRNRFTETPSARNNYSAQVIYSEPVFNKAFLQFSYRFNYNWNENDRQTYSLDNISEYGFKETPETYKQFPADTALSKYSEYTTLGHDIQVSLRVNRDKFRLNTGVRIQPQHTELKYRTQGQLHTPIQNVINWNPTFDFRYMFTEHTNLRFRINGNSSQPSMTNLLDITDNTNPLNITQGNPNLKPSFTTNFNVNFNTYNVDKQNSFTAWMSYRTTSNSISNRVEYNAETGGQTTRPDNINGNWNINGNLGGNITLPDQRFTINSSTGINYSNQVGYLYQNQETMKATTKQLVPSERLSASFRDEKVELTLSGDVNLNHSRNDRRPTGNMDTWNFNYGMNGNFTLPYNFRLAFDIFNSSRRGYEDDTYNTDELIWNAEIQKSFLKNKSAILSVQFFDILGQRKNYSRNISATSRSNTEYDVINQYFMLHFTYKLNIFNGKLIQDDEEGGRGQRGRGGNNNRGGNNRGGNNNRGGGGGGNYRR